MMIPEIFADFNNADVYRRIRLNVHGALQDLKRINLDLKEGMLIILNDGEGLSTAGIVKYSVEENIWVAEIDWSSLK